ncbi:hypothetical protein ACQKQC_05815 [Vibrio fortis]|uniref:hypothetical protein n=1 Tax=Vibrio fortis TaxID=212667 RepID=UPI0040687B18
MNNKKIDIFIRNDFPAGITMPLGKTVAQVSHALGLLVLNRCEIVDETDLSLTLKMNPELHAAVLNKDFVTSELVLNYVSEDEVVDQCGESVVVDRGKTIFWGRTVTCGAVARGNWLGADVLNNILSKEVVTSVNVMQGIFVNTGAITFDLQIIDMASKLSVSALMESFDLTTGQAMISKTSNLYRWLTNGYGKTVVRAKKEAHMESLADELSCEGVGLSGLAGHIFATAPCRKELLERYTRTRNTRLL